MNNDMKNGEHNDLCVGIDLGTTNSVLATINVKPNGDIVSKVVDKIQAGGYLQYCFCRDQAEHREKTHTSFLCLLQGGKEL